MGMTLLRILAMGLAALVPWDDRVPHMLIHQELWQNAGHSQGSCLVLLFFVTHHIQLVDDLRILAILTQILFVFLIFDYLLKFVILIKPRIHGNIKSVSLL